MEDQTDTITEPATPTPLPPRRARKPTTERGGSIAFGMALYRVFLNESREYVDRMDPNVRVFGLTANDLARLVNRRKNGVLTLCHQLAAQGLLVQSSVRLSPFITAIVFRLSSPSRRSV